MSEIDSDSSEELNEQSQDENAEPDKEAEETNADNNQDEGSEQSDEDEDEEDDQEDVRRPVINPLNVIKNKDRRRALFKKLQAEKKKKRRSERRERRKTGKSGNGGHTIESLREPDQTAITNIADEENEELRKELDIDEFSSYFERSYEPKILVTFSDNPATKTRKFGLELTRVFPNALMKVRNNSSVKRMVKSATREGFSDILIINENRRQPNGLLIIHLPEGPTAHFKLSNVKLTKDLRRNHKEISRHRPELILTNFTTRLGLTIGRMFGALFHHDPEFRGRRVATFHNQRDYIFFRHHRYEFNKEGKRAKLRELGPRFTLKLRSLQEGTFDSKYGDYSWIITNKRHAMEGRRRFFL